MQESIMSGLNQSYDPIVSTTLDLDMDTFYAHLLSFDMRMEHQLALLQ